MSGPQHPAFVKTPGPQHRPRSATIYMDIQPSWNIYRAQRTMYSLYAPSIFIRCIIICSSKHHISTVDFILCKTPLGESYTKCIFFDTKYIICIITRPATAVSFWFQISEDPFIRIFTSNYAFYMYKKVYHPVNADHHVRKESANHLNDTTADPQVRK